MEKVSNTYTLAGVNQRQKIPSRLMQIRSQRKQVSLSLSLWFLLPNSHMQFYGEPEDNKLKDSWPQRKQI